MTLRELLYRKSYKNIFNVIYKTFLKDHPQDKIVDLSIKFEKAFRELKSVEQQNKTKNLVVSGSPVLLINPYGYNVTALLVLFLTL